MSRKLDNWLASYVEYTDRLESPLRFRTWAGIAAISAALQRKVWTRIKGQELRANTYIILVGPPGIGKGNAVKPAIKILREIKPIKMAPEGLTRRSFYDCLESSASMPSLSDDGSIKLHCSMTAFIEELGVFLKPGDSDFVYALCHAFDCPPWFHYKTSSAGENQVENVWFSMIAAATPKALKDILTDEAMEMGLSARTLLIFSDEAVDVEIFGDPPKHEQLYKDLESDLAEIVKIEGEYCFDEAAAEAFVSWNKGGLKPFPMDPRFSHYNSRRLTQIVKCCMIVAAARSNELIITLEDFEAVKSILLEAERVMPSAIQSLGANPLLAQQQQAIKFINAFNLKNNKEGMPEYKLRQSLALDVHPQYIELVLEQLDYARWVIVKGDRPDRLYWPVGKEE